MKLREEDRARAELMVARCQYLGVSAQLARERVKWAQREADEAAAKLHAMQEALGFHIRSSLAVVGAPEDSAVDVTSGAVSAAPEARGNGVALES